MKKKRKSGLLWVAIITGLMCGVTAGAFLALTHDLPQIKSLENFKPSAVTRIYSTDQVLLAELYIEKRDPVSLDQIPDDLKTALLTTEDRRFYEHSGLAVKGILRAMVRNLRKGRFAQGASTLTQQLAKTLFLTPRKTILRKLREAILALQLERRYTKDEILERYLNQVYFGSGAYGVASAARIYFGKRPKDLTLAQCALIAGLPKAPSRYSPLINPELAVKRRNIVLSQMRTTGAIDEETYEQAHQKTIDLSLSNAEGKKAPHFINHIKETLEEAVGASLAYKGGLTVYTTLSYDLQSIAETAVSQGLNQLETRMHRNRISGVQPQSALVALNLATGGIIAMVGGRDTGQSGYNRSTTAKRQPGSAFKPIVFALAIERGFHQNQKVLDAPIAFQSPSQGQDWQPHNFSDTYDGEISLRWALAHSKNIPAVRLIERLGPSSVVQFGQTLGLRTKLDPNLSLALGTSELNLLELTAAYAVFANRGKSITPYGITEIVDAKGKMIWRAKPEQRIAMSKSGAAIVTNMLEAVITEGTGRKAGRLPPPLAGKTGTTNEYKDALFVGFSPDIAAGVWVGNDDASTLGPHETGARAALPIWIAFMQQALSGQSQHYFDIPDDVRQISIHPRTGEKLPINADQAVRVLVRRTDSN